MTGKQHDVSECMDNCMFQIETALLKFDGLSGTDDDKGSIVKRYIIRISNIYLPEPPLDYSTGKFDNV